MIELLKNRVWISGAALITLLAVLYCADGSLSLAEDNQSVVFQGTPVEAMMAGVSSSQASGGTPAPSQDQSPKATAPTSSETSSQAAPSPKPAPAANEEVKPDETSGGKAPSAESQEAGKVKQPQRTSGSEKTKQARPNKGEDAPALLKQGGVLAKAGEHDQALETYQAALKKASAAGDQKLTAEALEGAARTSHQLGRDSEALGYVKRAAAINLAIKNAQARSLNYLLAGRILMAQADYAQALKSFEEALKIIPTSEAGELPGLLEDMAAAHLRLHRYSEAISTYNRLLSIYAKAGDNASVARTNVLMGEIQVSRSDYRGARVNFKKAEAIYRDLKRRKELGETLFRIAYLEQNSGDFIAARKAVAEGQSLMDQDGDAAASALPLVVKGMDAYNEGKLIQAVKSLTAALSGYETAGDRVMAERVRLILGNLELDRARFESALELGGKALEQFRQLSATGGEAAALRLIGEVYSRQGFVQKALEYGQDALAAAKKIGDRNQSALSRILLSDIYMGMGDAAGASKALKGALDDAKAGINRRSKSELRLAIARYRFSREASERALQDAAEARKEFVEIHDRRGIAGCDHLMGLVHELRGEREKSLALLQQALTEHRALWDRFGEGKDLTALGVHFKSLGDQEKALEYFKTALDLRKGIGDSRGYAATLANIGNLFRRRNKVSEAQQSLEQALAVYRELSDKKGEADVLTNLGNVDAARGSQTAALEKFSSALTLHREIQDSRGVATDLASMGRLYLARGDLQNATDTLQEAQKVNKRIRNPRGDVTILGELAMLQRTKGNFSQALALLKQALDMAQQMDDAQSVSSVHLKMATVLEDSGDYPKALALLRDTLATMRQQGDRKGELWALGGIGVIQVKTEDYENALNSLHAALKLRTELGVPPSQSRDLEFYLGEIYEGFRDLERALDYYHRSLSMAQTPGNDGTLGRIYDRIGNIYCQMEEYSKAKEFVEDALRVYSERNNVAMQKRELIRLGDILSKLGDTEGALKYQTKALNLATETNDERVQARVLTRMGTLYQLLGKPRVALEHYSEAQEKRTKLGDRRGVNENLLQIALVTSILGNFEDAVGELKRAFEIAHASEDRSMLWKAYFIMGRALEGKKRYGEALEAYKKAITILEAMEADIIEESDEDNFIFGGKTALFETTLRVLMTLAKKDPAGAYDNQALRIVEKLKAAEFENTLSRINVDRFSDLPQDLLVKEKSLKLSLRRINSRLAEELSKGSSEQPQVQKLLRARRAKEKVFADLKERLIKEYPSYADLRYPRPLSVHQLQKEIIDPDEAILEYMVTRSRTYIFALDRQRFHTYSIEYSSKDLERDVDLLTRPLHRADTQANWDPSVAYRLYTRVIKPIEYFLAAKKTVVVIPHGPLSALPFEVLVDSKAHAQKRFWSVTDRPSYLLEKYAFAYAPSCAVLASLRTRKRDRDPGWNLVAFGDAVYQDEQKKREPNPGAERLLSSLSGSSPGSRGPELRPLPGARREISEIVKIMGGPTQTYLGAQATETLFKKADLSRYKYIHLATHGLLVGGAGKLQQQPAIIFSLFGDHENDGFLQLGEVFGLKLNSDLVVVSSCLSPGKWNPGEANGLVSLCRAFLFAGTDSVILSTWQVNDESTAKLFIEMYSNLKTGSKAEALRQAKLALLNNPSTSHPFYWGPFILMGNWKVRYNPASNRVDSSEIRIKAPSAWKKLLHM
jgi:tetratricopeptide (TPR) repeat protein